MTPVVKGAARSVFFCTACGSEFGQWAGRCPQCREWDTLAEAPRAAAPAPERAARRRGAAGAELPESERARPLPEVPLGEGGLRLALPGAELSRVLGGGLTRGSAVLVAGDPGVGKSTMLLELAGRLAASGSRCLYASCEESAAQTRLRAERLGASSPGLLLLARADLGAILAEANRLQPELLVVDSIQMAWTEDSAGSAGSPAQVRECAAALIRFAKESGCALFLVGHVTKEGSIAGPRLLEHMVDTVLHFEPAGSGSCRQLRAVKNRFGPTDEVAFFEMTAGGLSEIADPSSLLLGEHDRPRQGAAAFPALGGSRVLMVEIQALCAPAAEGYARRRTTGLDAGRLHMLLAVLARRAGLALAGCDVFANAAGGLEVAEPAADLAICAAVASSLREVPVAAGLALVGEVGLGGELRPAARLPERLREAARHGFRRILVPRRARHAGPAAEGIEVVAVASLGEALEVALG